MDIGIGASLVAHSAYKSAKNVVNMARGRSNQSSANVPTAASANPFGPVIVFEDDGSDKPRRRMPRKAKIGIVAAVAVIANWGLAPDGRNILGSSIAATADGGPIAGIKDIATNISESPIFLSAEERLELAETRRERDLLNYKILAGDILYDGEAVPFNFDVYSVDNLPESIQKFNEIFPGWFMYEAKRIESETQIPWAVIAGYQMANCSDAHDVQLLAQCLNAAVTDEASRNILVGNMQGFAENLRNRLLSADPKKEEGLYQQTAQILKELGKNPADVKRIFSDAEVMIAIATFYKRTDLSYAIKPDYLVNVNGTYVHKDMAKEVEALVGEATADGISLETTGWIPIMEIRNRRLACFSGKDLQWEERVRLIWEAKPGDFARDCGVNPLPIPGQGVHMDGRAVDLTCTSQSTIAFGESECRDWLEERTRVSDDPIVFEIGDKLQTSSAAPWELRMEPITRKPLSGVIADETAPKVILGE